MAFNIYTVHGWIFRLWRQKRLEWFLQKIKPAPTDTMLDVGGLPGSWIGRPQPVARIDMVNPRPVELRPSDALNHNIRSLAGDGCSLPMADQSYDIGYSNSVIEHVGSWERQCRFAAEIRRVARRLWVQTPAYACPIEPHFLAPFVHYLPLGIRKPVVRWATPYGWIQRPSRAELDQLVDETRLLKKSEMQQLFPDCEILTERMFWLIPKSYIAVRT